MMFLSKVILRPSGPIDCHSVHRLLWRGFPSMPSGARPFLFRYDRNRHDGRASLECLVQSTSRPSWDELGSAAVAHAVKDFAPKIRSGDPLRFLLRANAVRSARRAGPDGPIRGKRLPLGHEEDRMGWLERKSAVGGFKLDGVWILRDGLWTWRDRGKVSKLTGVDFVGCLWVTDPDLFLETIHRGIGPAKGLGFGMLSIARA